MATQAYKDRAFNTLHPDGLNDRFDTYNSEDSMIPIIVPYSENANTFANELKSLAQRHNVLPSGRIVTAFTRSKNLGELLK